MRDVTVRAAKRATDLGNGDPLLSRVRRLCLSLPETSETSPWGHPNFRAGKRTFVTFERIEGIDTIAFHLHLFEVEDLQGRAGFARTPYGQGSWVSLRIRPRPKWPEIEDLVMRSYSLVALKRMLQKLESPYASKPCAGANAPSRREMLGAQPTRVRAPRRPADYKASVSAGVRPRK